MKKCPGCGYLWADDYTGQCHECGKPLGSVQGGDNNLQFRYANQVAASRRENDTERQMRASSGRARPGDAYDRLNVPDSVMQAALAALVQREDVQYEES